MSTPSQRRREGRSAYYGQTEDCALAACPYGLPSKVEDWMAGWYEARRDDEAQQAQPPSRDELFMELLDLVGDMIQHVNPYAVPGLLERHNELAVKAQEVMT